ncbi:pan domain-containing [Fusarium longipes]|uniref:Pan domain-containing n=1 Tax=Fusarium longipes TaxID=694270 RepID=A0A395T1Z9_9HYPO|nr:pan domain-containing [Fusarium longipes]
MSASTTTTSVVVESSSTVSVSSTEVTLSPDETLWPTTTTRDVTFTSSTEPAETTTVACVPPEGAVCGKTGSRQGGTGGELVKNGRFDSLEHCAQDCANEARCKIVAYRPNVYCELWSEIPTFSNAETSYKWYEPSCLCVDTPAETTTTEGPAETTTVITEAATTTTKAPAETSCTAPENAICGERGTRATGAGYIGRGDDGSLAECEASCKNDPTCRMFAFTEGGDFCKLWSEVSEINSFPAPFKRYELSCFCDEKPAGTTTTTVEATTTTETPVETTITV